MDRQKEFDTVNGLGFPLLSDADRSIAKQFGTKRFGPIPSKRQTFVIDTDAYHARGLSWVEESDPQALVSFYAQTKGRIRSAVCADTLSRTKVETPETP